MKRFAASVLTLMMSAAIGAAAANPYDHGGNGYAANPNWNQGNHANVQDHDRGRWNGGDRDRDGNGRWNGRGNWRGDHDRDDRGWNGWRGGWYGYRGGWNTGYGWRYQPRYVNVAIGGSPYYYGGPAYYAPSYYEPAPAYGYGYEGGPAYGYDTAYACPPGRAYRVHRDNTGAKVLGALVGGALGNTVGKGDGRTAATVAGAAIGYGIASDATRDRGYEVDCGR